VPGLLLYGVLKGQAQRLARAIDGDSKSTARGTGEAPWEQGGTSLIDSTTERETVSVTDHIENAEERRR